MPLMFRVRSGFVVGLTSLSVLSMLPGLVSVMRVLVLMLCLHCAVFCLSHLFVVVHSSRSSLRKIFIVRQPPFGHHSAVG